MPIKHLNRNWVFWLLPLALLAQCKDPEEPIPAYLKIEPFSVDATGGAAWQKITEAWVYAGNEFLGGYSLPALVPVLAEGNVDLQIFPGVRENGQTATPGLYPFLDRFESTVSLTAGQTTVVQPATRYTASAIFPWQEDRTTFDLNSLVLENRDGDTATAYRISADGAFEGRSVNMQVDTAHRLIEIATEPVENLPNTGDRPVWLELHYRNNIPFELWLLGSQGSNTNELSQAIFQFAPSEQWNKIYFNLTDYLVNLQQTQHRLFFRVLLPVDNSGKPLQASGEVYLDNIRLVHF